MPHLVVSISSHGFGHVAQTAPILNRLHERMPQLRLTLRSEPVIPEGAGQVADWVDERLRG